MKHTAHVWNDFNSYIGGGAALVIENIPDDGVAKTLVGGWRLWTNGVAYCLPPTVVIEFHEQKGKEQ